ncbi:hypothetical protein U0070_019239 [Myodes glareolus]|uniref:Uncharacterized protein n=1 Tax=Myodes glareolus TaxID=447135 RepID=A0AAW0IA57_MYOGA
MSQIKHSLYQQLHGWAGGLSSSPISDSPSSKEALDPIAERLSQLSEVRRFEGGQLHSSGLVACQLQQSQMQPRLERQLRRQQENNWRQLATQSHKPLQAGALTQVASPLQSHSPWPQPTQPTRRTASRLSRTPSSY